MTSAIRKSLKSFTDVRKQPNLMCYEIRHPTSLVEMFAVTTDNSRRLLQILGKWNRMLNGCMMYQIILRTMSDVRCQDCQRIYRCDPKWLRGPG